MGTPDCKGTTLFAKVCAQDSSHQAPGSGGRRRNFSTRAPSGWPDQCWTLPRIAEVVRARFGVRYTLAGLDLLLHRIGWSVQVPSRKATERDEGRIAAWKDEQWPVIKGGRWTWAPGSASRTRPGRA
ncbi:winged helix-turn-helix domain-containing protein [Streptomyces sp. NPDC005969]|uniref:helix-turn-helix domain-containing protein n=1 Tax=Streptomyces sp. NPDC005969 TaxID=3156722 RepID=UPI00340BD739